MVLHHKKRVRKASGGKYKKFRDKRKRELGRYPALTKVSETNKVKKIRVMGGNFKLRARESSHANVLTKDGKFAKVKIIRVIENKASRHFSRMNIITKGAIIETEVGKAKVTNRPGQDGTINAVIVE